MKTVRKNPHKNNTFYEFVGHLKEISECSMEEHLPIRFKELPWAFWKIDNAVGHVMQLKTGCFSNQVHMPNC